MDSAQARREPQRRWPLWRLGTKARKPPAISREICASPWSCESDACRTESTTSWLAKNCGLPRTVNRPLWTGSEARRPEFLFWHQVLTWGDFIFLLARPECGRPLGLQGQGVARRCADFACRLNPHQGPASGAQASQLHARAGFSRRCDGCGPCRSSVGTTGARYPTGPAPCPGSGARCPSRFAAGGRTPAWAAG